jgi:transposase-like protein
MFASEIRRTRAEGLRAVSRWRWHLDEMFVRINGETHYLWRAVDHEGEILESFVTRTRDRKAALKFLRKSMRRSRTTSTRKARSLHDHTTRLAAPPLSPSGVAFWPPDIGARLPDGDQFTFV